VVSFLYRGRRGAEARRRTELHGLVTVFGRWYLVAYDLDRAGWRSFRLDRLAELTLTRRRFTPRPLPDGDLAAHVERTIAAAPYRYVAQATVRAPAEEVSARLRTAVPGQIEAIDGRSCRVRLRADSLDFVVQPLAALCALGLVPRVEGPPELLDELRAAGRQLLEAALAAPQAPRLRPRSGGGHLPQVAGRGAEVPEALPGRHPFDRQAVDAPMVEAHQARGSASAARNSTVICQGSRRRTPAARGSRAAPAA
jgi:hypothetical protein